MAETDVQIILYDVTGNVEGNAWAPHTWKARLALNHKRIKYRTEWQASFPVMWETAKSLGAPPLEMKPSPMGELIPRHTVPFIHDLSTGVLVTDSLLIAEYLDKAYPAPEYPVLVPKGTEGFHRAFDSAFHSRMEAVIRFINPGMVRAAPTKEDRALFRQFKEAQAGMTLEEMELGEDETKWAEVRKVYAELNGWFERAGGTFIMGDKPVFADMQVAGYLMCFKKLLGDEGSEFTRIADWDEKRWRRIVDGLDASVH